MVPDGPRPPLTSDRPWLQLMPDSSVDGAAGLTAAAAAAPAAVVLDLLMPTMDGLEFLARYRATPAGRGVPVIVSSAKELTVADRARLSEAATRVVPKRAGSARPLLDTLEAVLPPRG